MKLNFVIAILFTLFLNTTGIYYHLSQSANTSLSITHIDEITYLPQAIKSANGLSINSFYIEHSETIDQKKVITEHHSSITDVIFGNIAKLFNLSATTLGLVVDMLCSFFAYLIYISLFKKIFNRRLFYETCTWASLILPSLMSLDKLKLFPTQLSNTIYNVPIYRTLDLPILRGLYTQVSLLCFGIILNLLVSFVLQKNDRKKLILAGTLAGLSIHVYFFSWAASIAIGSLNLVLVNIKNLSSLRRSALDLISFLGPSLLSSTLGLWMIFFNESSLRKVCDLRVRNYWFLSPELLILLAALCLATILVKKENIKLATSLSFSTVACLLVFFFMNAQPALGCIISPFRFHLYTSLTLTGFFLCSAIIFTNRINQSIAKIFCTILLATLVLSQAQITLKKISRENDKDFKEAITELNSYEKDAVISVYPLRKINDAIARNYPIQATANIINMLTGRYLLSQAWTFPSSSVSTLEMAQRELLQNWIHSQKLDLVTPCSKIASKLTGDMLSLTWDFHIITREKLCEEIKSSKIRICNLLKSYKVDYVYIDNKDQLSSKKYLREVWSKGEIKIFRFKKDEAIKDLCGRM